MVIKPRVARGASCKIDGPREQFVCKFEIRKLGLLEVALFRGLRASLSRWLVDGFATMDEINDVVESSRNIFLGGGGMWRKSIEMEINIRFR